MTDRPILFSGPMVNAILEGRKSQTRRVLKPDNLGRYPVYQGGKKAAYAARPLSNEFDSPSLFQVGDRLYVREAWTTRQGLDKTPPRDISPKQSVGYMADDEGPCLGKFRQGMHMPRWASRLTLVVTDVRVQRVQEISEEDAIAEGINMVIEDSPSAAWFSGLERETTLTGDMEAWHLNDAPAAFRDLWNSINDARGFGWDTNPWVVAVTFETYKCNIDQMGAT